MAVDGDGTALTAVVEPDIAYGLLRPARAAPWQLAPGPGVTQIEVWDLEPDREPPELRAQFRFADPRPFDDPSQSEEVGTDPSRVGLAPGLAARGERGLVTTGPG